MGIGSNINSHQHFKAKTIHILSFSRSAKHGLAMKMGTTGQPAEGHLWLVFTMLFVTSAVRSVGASSFAPPPSVSVSSPAYDPVIKVVGKVYCYRCFDEAHPDESHGKKHLQGETSCLPLLLRSHRANAVSCPSDFQRIIPECPSEFHVCLCSQRSGCRSHGEGYLPGR